MGSTVGLAVTIFLASAVESVEALTIVLAVAVSRGHWRSALIGVGAALAALAIVIAVVGRTIRLLPLSVLDVALGMVLIYYGFQWLRKAVLRAAGRKAMRDERAVWTQTVAAADAQPAEARSWDGYAFGVSFQGVFTEGVEVMLIVVTLGAHHLGVASAAALSATLLVTLVGAVVRGPLTRVPENTMKFAVGVMLSAFGVFYAGEGLGASWPGGEASLLGLLALVLGSALLAVRQLRGRGLPV